MRNQSILVTPAINVSTTPHSSQHFLAMKIPMLSSKLVSLETKMCDKMMAITSYFKNESHSLKKESSGKTKDVSHNSNNSKTTNAPQYNNELVQNLNTSLKNRISLLESEKRSLKDNVAIKQSFLETLLNFNESNVLSHNIITSSSIIQKKTNIGS